MGKRILAVATNCGPQVHYGQTGLWLSELTHFTHEIARAGHEVTVASPKGGKIPLDVRSTSKGQMSDPANQAFLSDPRTRDSLENSAAAGDLKASDFDLIYLSGGHGTMWDFRQSPELQRLITEMYSSGKLVTGVCHGVAGFIDSVDRDGNSIVKGKKVTGFSNFEDRLAGSLKYMPYLLETDIKAKGALYRKNLIPFTPRVEEEGNLLTGQNPQSAKSLALRSLQRL